MKQRKLTRLVCIILAAVMLLSLVAYALTLVVGAASSKEILKELEALRAEQSEIKAKSDALEASIQQNQSKTQTLVQQKADLDQQMEITRITINNLHEQVQQYSLLIAEKQKELEAAQEAEAQLQEQYRTRLRSMEETGSVSYWSILFQASSFSDLLDRVDMIREIAKSDQVILEQLAAATAAVEKERTELEQQRQELERTEQELNEQQTLQEQQREESNKMILQMQVEYAALSEDYKAAEAAEDELRKTIKQTETAYFNALSKEEAERIAALNKANNNKVSQNAAGATATGGFLFPLAWSNGVTCAYGPRTHPIYGYQSNHTGVDLGSGMNTEIYATKSGTVTASSYGEANGYYTTINHGDGYSSLYAHMVSNEVSVGDYVTQGQVIGHVGMSGWTTGAHLHFEILYNGSNVNPMNYISLP